MIEDEIERDELEEQFAKEIEAIGEIFWALHPLNENSRHRIMNYVWSKLKNWEENSE